MEQGMTWQVVLATDLVTWAMAISPSCSTCNIIFDRHLCLVDVTECKEDSAYDRFALLFSSHSALLCSNTGYVRAQNKASIAQRLQNLCVNLFVATTHRFHLLQFVRRAIHREATDHVKTRGAFVRI
jgi:hypothetical protein